MVNFGHVRRWRAEPLDTAEQGLKTGSDRLVGLADELGAAATPAGWVGAGADAAASERDRLAEAMEHVVAGVNAARTALMAASDQITGLGHLVAEADALAAAHGFTIDNSGEVHDGGLPPGVPADQVPAVHQDRAQVRAELADRVRQIVARAEELDTTLAAVLDKVAHGQITDGGAASLAEAAAAGAAQGSLHERLLAQYRVAPDPDGMVNVPFMEQDLTASELTHLADLQLLGFKDAYDIYQRSLTDARAPFDGAGETNGHTDAVRHTLWNAMLANRFGAEWTEGYTTAHERKPHTEGVHASEQAMDLHNNEVGRRIAATHPDAGPDELMRHVEAAVRNGETVVIGTDGRLVRSNEVAVGDTLTEEASDPPPTGGRDPGIKPENTPGGYDYGGGYNPGEDGETYGTYDVR